MTDIADVVAALRSAGLAPAAVDVAEALWLAQVIDVPVGSLPSAEPDAASPELPPADSGEGLPVSAATPADPSAELHPYTSDDAIGDAGDVLRLRSPGVPALPHALELGRALRGLRHYTPSARHLDVDEAETADRIAQERLWIPVLKPRPEPDADLALIVDSSASMAVWHPTLRGLVLLLQRLGAFRDIRSYSVDSDGAGELSLLPLGARLASPVDPNSIADPTGRRLFIVVTDGVGEGWHDGRMDAQLQRWGAANRTQVLSVLPRRMWRATGLRTRTGTTSRPRVGERIPVPVLELSLNAIRRRAAMIGRPEGAAILLPPDRSATPEPPPTDPAKLVRRFLSLASPTAQRLAGYLAAAPLTLPAMRLVQQVMLPDSSPTHLAEVYLSGLIQLRAPAGPDDDIDAMQFEFVPGVRELLLDATDRAGSIRVLTMLSQFVTDRFGRQALDFPALLRAPEKAKIPELSGGALPIARIAASVLRGLGPRFVPLADSLEAQSLQAVAHHVESESVIRTDRLGFGVDVVDHASRGAPALRALLALIQDVLREIEADDLEIPVESTGDGLLVVLNWETDTAETVVNLLTTMANRLRRHNAADSQNTMRLRVGVARGPVVIRGSEISGPLPVEIARLRDCGPLRRITATSNDVQLAAAISDSLHTDLGSQGDAVRRLRALIRVEVETRDFSSFAWVWTAGGSEAPATGPSSADADANEADVNPLAILSPAELAVLAEVAKGRTNLEISERLFLSRKTVDSHLRKIFGKLGVHTRAEAAQLFARSTPPLPRLNSPREFLAELELLYRAAGMPSFRRISATISEDDSMPDTVGHETVSSLFQGVSTPRWSKVESVVRVLSKLAVTGPDPDSEVRRFHTLWLGARTPMSDAEVPVEEGVVEHPTSEEIATPSGAAMSARKTLADTLPVFYLSYARSDPSRSDNRVRKLFSDLSDDISDLLGLRLDQDPGFMDMGVGGGLRWSDELVRNLGQAQVFVPLLSMPYLHDSEWCAMEWDFFSRREVRSRSGTTRAITSTAFIPVLWTPIREPVPPVVAQIQRFSPSTIGHPEQDQMYRAEGLLGLMNVDPSVYRAVVWRLAREIADVYRNLQVEPSNTSSIRNLRRTFAEDGQ